MNMNMNLKSLRDYLNCLNLDEVQPEVEVVYHTQDGSYSETMACFTLCTDKYNKPYLSISCESFLDDINGCIDDN